MVKGLTAPVLIIGSPGDPSDLRYKTGFSAVDPMVFLQAPGKQFIVVPLLELGRAKKTTPRATVFVPQDLGIPRMRRRYVEEWAAALLRHLKIRRVRVPATFPAGVYERLVRAGVRIDVVHGPLFPERAVKSPREIENIAQAQRASVAAMKSAIALITASRADRAGFLVSGGARLTSERVRHAIDQTLLAHDCAARDTIIAGGSQAADPHDRGSGPLRAGETIVIDIFPQHKKHGYWGDITRTVVKGRAAPEVRRMYAAVSAAQKAALEKIRAGASTRAIHEEVQRVFAARKFETSVKDGVARGFFHGTGHGVGLDIHEAPSVSLADDILRAGHVVTVEPGLYYPEHGGVRIEDTVVVTKTGWRYLASCPKPFEV